MTSIGGLVGNGNIAGVATAITAGGPGALFWMWVSGVIGMGTMFAESVLGVRYRHRGADGLMSGDRCTTFATHWAGAMSPVCLQSGWPSRLY